MEGLKKRTTIYLDKKVHKILKLKSLEVGLPISELIENAICHEMGLDEEDLAAFKEREKEPAISYENMLKELKKDGKI